VKIGFDIGGVISKYPEQFKRFFWDYFINKDYPDRVYIITDQHPKEQVIKTLADNGFEFIFHDDIYCADYEKYGNMAKAVLIKELGLDIFIDDFDGYLQWDSSLGPQPILLKVMPDVYKPYWADSWKCEDNEFGRRKYT
jgi:acid phosphatase class B